MKKIILTYGLLAGIICPIGFFLTMGGMDFDKGMIFGFASMIIAFSLIFVAITQYKNKVNGGYITFGKAFQIGLFITLIGSTVYVATWLFYLYNFFPDFAVKYGEHYIQGLKAQGASAAIIAAKTVEMKDFVEDYKNPLVVIAYTYMEITWVGLVITLIASLILKKKPQPLV